MHKSSLIGALLLGLALAAGYAAADTSAGDKQKPAKEGKAKPGAACKVDADCDQGSQPQTCHAGKCQVRMPPPPT